MLIIAKFWDFIHLYRQSWTFKACDLTKEKSWILRDSGISVLILQRNDTFTFLALLCSRRFPSEISRESARLRRNKQMYVHTDAEIDEIRADGMRPRAAVLSVNEIEVECNRLNFQLALMST